MKVLATFMLALVLLTACAFEKPEIDQRAQSQMIGLTKKKIGACLGFPARRRGVGATEVWSYDVGHVRIEGEGFATFGHARHDACAVTVVMTHGVVSQVLYSGVGGDALDLGERCIFDVDRCVE
jgi:hypothetical protein